jgi:hypothetical protein
MVSSRQKPYIRDAKLGGKELITELRLLRCFRRAASDLSSNLHFFRSLGPALAFAFMSELQDTAPPKTTSGAKFGKKKESHQPEAMSETMRMWTSPQLVLMMLPMTSLLSQRRERSGQQERLDINCQTNKDNETALSAAACSGDLPIVRLLLKDTRTDLNAVNKAGETAIWLAASNGHFTVVMELLRDSRLCYDAEYLAMAGNK